MRLWISRAALMGGLSVAPTAAAAQHATLAKHEFGVDIAAAYEHQSLGSVSADEFVAGTPVDLRVGFIAGNRLVLEPRIFFRYASKGGFNTGTGESVAAFELTPDLNILVAFRDNKRGPYV